MDPTAVDFRAFYQYTPNEVKHRKRTTSAQLKILEGIFKRDTKPNAALRNELAAQLDMTARGVQVWFQNRRAKEKNKANKVAAAVAAAKSASTPDSSSSSPSSSPAEVLAEPQPLPETSSEESSPTRSLPPQLQLVTDSDISSYQSSPLVTPDDPLSHLHFLRRGSLPAGNLTPHSDSVGPPLVGHLDPFQRRRSVDASLHRLAANPYAQHARAKNGAASGAPPRISGHANSKTRPQPQRPAPLPELPTPPHHARHVSADHSRAFSFSPSPSPLGYYPNTIRASLPDNNLYAFSSRPVGSPIPGPLPAPGFQFGAASVNPPSSVASPGSADSERSSPDPFRGFNFQEDDDDRTSAYDAYSRFGSIASIATDSSHTSAYYSDGPCDPSPDQLQSRRESCTSAFLGLMSNLDVNGFHESYSPEEGINPTAMGLMGVQANSAFPSPCSTVSARNSPMVNDGASVPVSRSSELAFALQNKHEPIRPSDGLTYGHHSDPPNNNASTDAPFFYSMDGNYTVTSTAGDFDSSELTVPPPTTYDLGYPDGNAVYPVEGIEYMQNDPYPPFPPADAAPNVDLNAPYSS